ncbi:MAG: hypothetical protein IJH40_05360 [Ruminococcus sp.]|uniref:hypothetical protein n=1 Tax=Ruminococcus sp. TaxID=41978 RepID=UPI002873E40C|nr:hypothetical protein [Ruminococcus sp.]MBQ3285055.1 hypothetical protein [Ruminococcus sp.]
MKITTFNPFIVTSQVDDTIKLFETLGFERRHTKEGIEIADRDDSVIRMKDANGFYLDILKSNVEDPRDTVGIRMNVDDFNETYRILLQRGFKNAYGDEIVKTESSKAAMMISPSGFNISIIQHIKK